MKIQKDNKRKLTKKEDYLQHPCLCWRSKTVSNTFWTLVEIASRPQTINRQVDTFFDVGFILETANVFE